MTSTSSPAGEPLDEQVDRRYLDPLRPVAERVEILLGQMTLEEKAGLFFQTMVVMGEGGALAEDGAFGLPSTATIVLEKRMSHFNLLGGGTATARELAEWHNRVQELASSSRLGIPVTLSTDPRHSFTDNPGTGTQAEAFSQWPEPLGLAAIGDEDLVERFGDIARQEYLAVGLRVALHPQIDLATESRWARQVGTFGEDAELTGRLGAAYIRGFQGDVLGAQSVATMTKHFPGGGPQKDGEDPHFPYGREQVYPGGNAEYHLQPFVKAFEAGTSQIMPYYGMPVGTEHEEVGFGFNRSVITGLLRERFGFDGIVCTDWGLLSDSDIMGDHHVARAWGVEHLSVPERMAKALDAGVDQFGGESIPETLVALVEEGTVAEERLDVSVRRLLREKFVLGLFDARAVDPGAAEAVVGSAEFRAAGDAAQRAAITVLAQDGVLPARQGLRLYVEGIDPAVAAEYGDVVDAPEEAELAVIRLQAPFERRATAFENHFHAGSLDFPDEVVEHVLAMAAQVPTIVDVFLDRPAILTPLVESAAALLGDFGASGAAVLDVVFGVSEARGTLPMDLPRSMAAAAARRPDVPFDTADPLFRFGHGLRVTGSAEG
ncbi:glycoside hydrolase family 3 protein [Rathayibacter sp. VKM Ac-2857]|uniref:glycoside hydrolase family 3 protein n=1 Tax=Rathayibacter sp. VKM Ac-2857 TaxID=2739020 RepID=UPI0015634EB0|nr:glycoside hydrolase family 3 N-terminal domain-containing protein [Rathayibacter sp. VKM Ac-2857]NQX17891.1 glycoside hydrolase family 3 C-terminal domain-containing protein [Rathayibacter sp. VKM Ac-2857]